VTANPTCSNIETPSPTRFITPQIEECAAEGKLAAQGDCKLSLFSPCPEIGVIANGEFKFELDVDHSFPGLDGDTRCEEGYRALGANPITCQLGGEWSDDAATCEPCRENCLQCDESLDVCTRCSVRPARPNAFVY
jgi:hypothetical protein